MPSQDAIESQLSDYMERLSVTGVQDSVIRTVSYLAERYLVISNGLLTLEIEEMDVVVADVGTGEFWLAAFKS